MRDIRSIDWNTRGHWAAYIYYWVRDETKKTGWKFWGCKTKYTRCIEVLIRSASKRIESRESWEEQTERGHTAAYIESDTKQTCAECLEVVKQKNSCRWIF